MPRSQNGCFKQNHLKPIFETVVKTVADHDMFTAGDRVMVAVSGGPDSVALLGLLNELAPRLSITLGVAHLNHGLRPEAEKEARSVKNLAQTLGLPFYLESRDVAAYRSRHKFSLEEAAREVRYAFYKKVLAGNGYQKVALGHHREDNAEMVLINLIRGSGPLGLSGIPPVRGKIFVRPLINLSRAQILAYIDHRRLEYVSDPSNADPRFTRNRIRHFLLPLIQKEFNANILETLHRTATIISDENDWLESVVDPICAGVVTPRDAQQLSLGVAALGALSRAPARRVVRRAISLLRGNLRRITFAHVDALLQLAATGNENARVDLPGLITVVKKKDRLILKIMDAPRQPLAPEPSCEPYEYLIEARRINDPESLSLEITATGGRVLFQHRNVFTDSAVRGSGQRTAFFDIEQLSFPLRLRNCRPGDRFVPLGMSGSKKLKKLFNERRVRRSDRERCPVLVSGKDIIWVLGHRQADIGRVSRQTRRVLEVKYVLPDEK